MKDLIVIGVKYLATIATILAGVSISIGASYTVYHIKYKESDLNNSFLESGIKLVVFGFSIFICTIVGIFASRNIW